MSRENNVAALRRELAALAKKYDARSREFYDISARHERLLTNFEGERKRREEYWMHSLDLQRQLEAARAANVELTEQFADFRRALREFADGPEAGDPQTMADVLAMNRALLNGTLCYTTGGVAAGAVARPDAEEEG